MKKLSITILMLLGLTAGTFAQEYNTQAFRFTVGINGGLSAFTVGGDNANGSLKMGVGYGIDLGLTTFLSEHWGIKAGLGFSAANSQYTFDNITATRTISDGTNTYRYTSTITDPKYKFQSFAATIPLQLAFRNDHWYANLGFKVQIPVKAKVDYSISGTETDAQVTNLGVSITPSSPIASAMGCTRTGEQTISNAANFRHSTWHCLAAFDGGVRFVSTPTFAWTIGVYGEISLNRPQLQGDAVALTLQDDGSVVKTVNPMPIDKLGYFAFGLKLTCDFGIKAK